MVSVKDVEGIDQGKDMVNVKVLEGYTEVKIWSMLSY